MELCSHCNDIVETIIVGELIVCKECNTVLDYLFEEYNYDENLVRSEDSLG